MRRRNNHYGNPVTWFLHPWMIGAAFLFAFILFISTLFLLWAIRPGPSTSGQVTAVLNVIHAPTATQLKESPTPSVSPTTTSQVPPPPPPGVVSIGAYVQIVDTGGEGLRLRFEPGLNSQVRLLGSEAEVFRVDEGPKELDGYTWWYLVGPFDETRHGWAVSNYLVVVQNP